MNLNNVRRLIIFCAALLAGLVLGAMQGHAQTAATAPLLAAHEHVV